MARRIIVLLAAVAVILPLHVSPVAAQVKTSTSGWILTTDSPSELTRRMNLGDTYFFNGHTSGCPSNCFPYRWHGYVKYSYKRPGATRWQAVGSAGSGGKAFWFDDVHQSSRVFVEDTGNWGATLRPMKAGWWQIRVKFPRQDGYAASRVIKKVYVRG